MKIFIQIILLGFLNLSISHATTFYVDPINGSTTANGSITNPWKTLKEVIDTHKIETKTFSGAFINRNAPVKAGDTIVLKSGYHGFITIENAFNDTNITVTAGAGQKPTLSGLKIVSAKNWQFSKLTISPILSPTTVTSSNIVSIGDGYYNGSSASGKTFNIGISNSHIYSFTDNPKTLSTSKWLSKSKQGIMLGRYASNLRATNNYIEKVSMAILVYSSASIINGNIITDYCLDAIRPSIRNLVIKDNVIKNNYHVDSNHADGIQGYASNPADLNNILIIGNIILNRDKTAGTYSGITQGIGFFDGPITNIQVTNNVIMAFDWHGIALYNSTNGIIINNVLFTPAQITTVSPNVKTRITLGSKSGNGSSSNNTISENTAYSGLFLGTGITNTTTLNNNWSSTSAGFMNALTNRLNTINATYGAIHPITGKTRVENDFMLPGGIDRIF